MDPIKIRSDRIGTKVRSWIYSDGAECKKKGGSLSDVKNLFIAEILVLHLNMRAVKNLWTKVSKSLKMWRFRSILTQLLQSLH